MKNFKTTLLLFSTLAAGYHLTAQKIAITKGGQTAINLVKGSEPVNFTVAGDNYFIDKYFAHAIMNFDLKTFDSKGASLANTKLEIKVGSFNNSYGINDIFSLGNKAYATVEHLDKPAGKNTLSARVMDNKGKISESEVELMSMPFEKTMNSGFNHSAVSPDTKMLAVVSELPFEKEQPAKLKIALYDQDLKKTKEGELSLPGENTKNKNIVIAVANDGTVYLIKKTMTKKGETSLAFYQWSSASPTDIKEYTFELTPPSNIFNYTYTVTASNELIVAGTVYDRKTFTAGEKQANGIFYFTNKGKAEKVLKTFSLDAPIDNLTARKLLVNGNTVFLTTEQYKEERISQPPTTGAMNFDYNYDYIHKSEFAIGMDLDGNKKFQLEMSKSFTARDFDKPYYSAYYICNNKLTVIYNDLTSKYIKNESYYQNQIPVLVQITNDGLMQPPVIFKNELKLDQYYILYPSFSVQNSTNQLSFLIGNNEYMKFINLKID